MAINSVYVALAIGAFVSASAAHQDTKFVTSISAQEQQLVAALDRAFKPKLLDTRRVEKMPDGSYRRWVSTGDAIGQPTISIPLKTVRTFCGSVGGTLELYISGGRETNSRSRISLEIGQDRMDLSRAEMWSIFGPRSEYANITATEGFKAVFALSPFAERSARSAEADPPFGLFGCKVAQTENIWAVAILPLTSARKVDGQYVYEYSVTVVPITASWIRGHNMRLAAAENMEIELERERAADIAHAVAEEERLRPFRAGLQVGSQTNCGMVITVRSPLIQVQLPPFITSPSGAREFWVRRDEVTDARAPTGCRYGA